MGEPKMPAYSVHEYMFEKMKREYVFVPGKLPKTLVVVLHQFGGTPETTLSRFLPLHEKGFPLLLPRGVENSWNGGACCGKAVQLGLNDVSFVRELTLHVLKEYKIGTKKAFVTGYSNGAFLTSQIALTSVAHGDHWLKAVAMVAGYSYDLSLYGSALKNDALTKTNAFPVLALHGTADESVRLGGCCEGNECCCQIFSPTCVSFREEVSRWMKIGKCSGSDVTNPTSMHALTSFVNNSCFIGKDCMQSMTFCEIPNAGHRLDNFIPVASIITEFFFKDYEHSKDTLSEVDVALATSEEVIRRHPKELPESESIGGVVIVILFLVALFFFLWRVFGKNRHQASERISSTRERQALTGRAPSSIFAAVQV